MSRSTVLALGLLVLASIAQAATSAQYNQPLVEESRATREQSTSSVPVTVFRLIQTYFAPNTNRNQETTEEAQPVVPDQEVSASTDVEATSGTQGPVMTFATNAASSVMSAMRNMFGYLSPVLMVAFPFLIPLIIGGGAAAARNFDFESLNRVDWGRYSDLAGRVQNAIQELRDSWEYDDYY